MKERDAIELIRSAIPSRGGQWADLGAGTGTFTRALAALVGSSGHVQAIEPNADSRNELLRQVAVGGGGERATITAGDGDFTKPLPLSGLTGILLANSLHFVSDIQQAAVLRQLVTYLVPSGRIVLVEYDRDAGNQWVPYPVSFRRFGALCEVAELFAPTVTGRTPSAFGSTLYAAFTTLA